MTGTHKRRARKKACPECGKVISLGRALFGLCPNCLLQQGLLSGERIEQFQLPSLQSLAKDLEGVEPIEFIGRGGMGAVYKARQCSLDRIVALKIIGPQAIDGSGIIQRFRREAQSLARLNHPNVVAIHDFGKAGDFAYFTMDFVDGVTLRRMLNSGALTPTQAVRLFSQLCDGLHHAHHNGVIHRDIKPENLLVSRQRDLKIADFGLAKLNGGNGSAEWKTSGSHRMGTLHYMAPEQIEQTQAVDHRADIYASAVVLYEMLTGELPLGRFLPPSRTAEVDSSLDAAVDRALGKNPSVRYPDILQFKHAVEAALFKKDEPPSNRTQTGARVEHAGQLVQWGEAVGGRIYSERREVRQIAGQLDHWAEVMLARSDLSKAA